MICRNCNKEISDDSKYCKECGVKVKFDKKIRLITPPMPGTRLAIMLGELMKKKNKDGSVK